MAYGSVKVDQIVTSTKTVAVDNLLDGATGSITSAMIAEGAIVNADINTNAAIAHDKLASIPAGYVLVGDANSTPTAVALSGAVSLSATGHTSIASGVIVDAAISASAAIAYSKLDLAGSIVSTDFAAGALDAGTY